MEGRDLMEEDVTDSRAGEESAGLRVRCRSGRVFEAEADLGLGGLDPGRLSASLVVTEERLDLLLTGLVTT